MKINARRAKKIAYILGTYPLLTTTFIDRELLEAKRLGLNMVLVAIRKGRDHGFSAGVQKFANETVYLLPVSAIRLIRSHLFFFITRFPTYVGTLTYLLTRKHPTPHARLKTLFHFGEGVLAAALLRKSSVNHLHAHFADRAAVVAMVIHRLLEVPYSITAHANDIYISPVFLAEKIKNAKFVATCTKYNQLHLEKETEHPVELIYHGLDFSDILPSESSLKNRKTPLVLSVGQLNEKKGFPYLIRACALLREKEYEFSCEIIGDGPEKGKLAELIEALNLSDIVTLRGALPHAEVLRDYPRAGLFVLPCVVARDGDRDGIPNVILEAMAHGLPVISTNISGIPEVVRNQETGWLIQSRSEHALTNAIAQVLDHPCEAAAIGRNGMAFVRKNFDIRQNVQHLIEMLTE